MFDDFSSAPSWIRVALFVSLDVAIKATALLVLTFVVHAALGRGRALVRSAIWYGGLVGLILMPASSLAFPRLSITIPASSSPAPAASVRTVAMVAEATPREMPRIDQELDSPPAIDLAEIPAKFPAPVFDSLGSAAPLRPTRSTHWMGFVLVAYLAGAAFLAIRLVVSLAAVHRWMGRCESIREGAWVEALERLRMRLGIAGDVGLLASDHVSVPAVVGWWRPSIILPRRLRDAAAPQVVDAVLLHELGHVRRGDYGWNLVRRLVQAIYWPHPLVWPLGRIIGSVREQACDDLCIHILGGAPAYRASLIEVASGLVRRPDPSLGLAMARTTNLARRLTWIDRSRGASACLLRRSVRFALLGLIATLAGAIGTIEFARARPVDEPQKPVIKADDEAKPEAPRPPREVEVVVRDKETGKPLEGARVRYWTGFDHFVVKTDRRGEVRIDLVHHKFRNELSLDVWADGFVQQRHGFSLDDQRVPKVPARLAIDLFPGTETLGGRVTDEQGKPVVGAKVEVWGYLGEMKEKTELTYKVDATTDDRGQWRCGCFRKMKFAYLYLSHPDYLADGQYHPRRHGQLDPPDASEPDEKPMSSLRDFSDVQVMTKGVEVAGKVVDERGRPIRDAEVGWLEAEYRDTFHSHLSLTTTDAEGAFRFPNARPGRIVIQVKAAGYGPELKMTEAKPGAGSLSVKLGSPKTLVGRVIDTRRKPIAGASVGVDTWRGYRALGVFLNTDDEGRFRWEDAPSDPVSMDVHKVGYRSVDRQGVSDYGEMIIMLSKSLTISGRGRDAETGKPIDRMKVEVGKADPGSGEIRWSSPVHDLAFRGRYQVELDAETPKEYRLRFLAEGYRPTESRAFRSDEVRVDYDVKLSKSDAPAGEKVSGVVRRPDGTPLEGADVVISYPRTSSSIFTLRTVGIKNGKLQTFPDLSLVKTDSQGRFTLLRSPDPEGRDYAVMIVHPDYFAEAERVAIEADPAIVAKPWGHIEGVVRVGSKPVVGAEVLYFSDRMAPKVNGRGEAITDAEGRFVFDRVIPGDARVRVSENTKKDTNPVSWSNGTLVEVRPGETARADIGGKGRPVIARIALPPGFDPDADYVTNSRFSIQSDREILPYAHWNQEWWASAEGHDYRRNWLTLSQGRLQPDGLIRAEDISPGDYLLWVTYTNGKNDGIWRSTDRLATATLQFTVPEIPGGRSDEPLDLGLIRPSLKKTRLIRGLAAPPFEIKTLDDRRLSLEDFRGKFLLIIFWDSRTGRCVAEASDWKRLHDQFGKDGRVAFLGLSLDADKAVARAFVERNHLDWPQGFVGAGVEGGVREAYQVEALPASYIIDPDGKFWGLGPPSDRLFLAIEDALRKP